MFKFEIGFRSETETELKIIWYDSLSTSKMKMLRIRGIQEGRNFNLNNDFQDTHDSFECSAQCGDLFNSWTEVEKIGAGAVQFCK